MRQEGSCTLLLLCVTGSSTAAWQLLHSMTFV
jgi:hypothetical protein